MDKDKGVNLKVVGILQPKEDTLYGCLQTGFYYTEALTKRILKDNINSEIVNYMKNENSLFQWNRFQQR